MLVLLTILFSTALFACQETIDEGPDTISITVLGLEGEGTLLEPYELEIVVGETIEKVVEIEGDYEGLEYVFGELDEDSKFVSDSSLQHISINARSTDTYLSVVGYMKGESMLRIKGKDLSSSAYIHVRTVERNGSSEQVKDFSESLKVLAIGNSFSEDAMTYLGEIAHDYGITEVVLGNMYIGGASLEQHWTTLENNTSSYTYYKNTDNAWINKGGKSLRIGLLDETWDIVTLQQASGKSGLPETYQPYLDNLIAFIKETKLTPTTFMWHQTWAYAETSTHSEFPNYDRDQMTMYNAIMSTVQSLIITDETFRQVIPSGTAIQNARTSSFGDHFNRDGFHLNEFGRYVAALTWFRTLTGFSIDDITYKPAALTDQQMAVAKEAANQAYANMFEVTEITIQ